jgi:hypothetical protein
MASKTFSIRLSDAEVELLQTFQASGDETLNQTVARLIRETIGANIVNNTANSANTYANNLNLNIKEMVRQEVEKAISAIASHEHLQEIVHIAVNKCTQNQNDILSDHEFRLGKLEEATSEARSLVAEITLEAEDEAWLESAIVPEATQSDVFLPQAGEPRGSQTIAETTPGESAMPAAVNYALESTQSDVVSTLAGKQLSKAELKSKVTSIQNTFRARQIKISQTIIKSKIAEMYPNSDDWISDDARLDVIRALEREHRP